MNVDISREAVEHLEAIHRNYRQWGTADTLVALRDALDRAEAAVSAEREQCAVIAEKERAFSMGCNPWMVADCIAALIRARRSEHFENEPVQSRSEISGEDTLSP
ncbi:MAG: hypothetical protein JWQ44_2931 [Chthoniobacter sp.]|nr:hypothetical protein [Chthoniobacter sp.]